MRILNDLGVFGWEERDENLVIASLLTGDPLLLIGNHGSAKTLLANKIAEALGKKFLVYDASKAMFEDVLGYPNVERLKEGVVEYVPSPVTVWDKEMVLIDELNRADLSMQSKWLTLIRSRSIMGFKTSVKWVWSAMNPMSYAGTESLDDALVGRFALFLYPPDVLQMTEEDRIKVAMHINGEDAPSLREWLDKPNGGSVQRKEVKETGERLQCLLKNAAAHFIALKGRMTTLSEFLAKFADLLMRETNGEIALDGRRLGFIYRNILAARSIDLAKSEIFSDVSASFAESARYVTQSSIPIGLSDEAIKREEALHKMEICFDLLSAYFEEGSEIARVNKIYELFTTENLLRRAKILIQDDLGEFAKSKAWNDLVNGERDITLLAYTALQVEARRPGTVPLELLESLSGRISDDRLSSRCIPKLQNESIEYVEEVEALLDWESDLERLIAYDRVRILAQRTKITPVDIQETRRQIAEGVQEFERLIQGGERHEDIQTVA